MIVGAVIGHGINKEIGIQNRLPWKLSDDLKNFKRVTMGKPIAMGRKTFESIGKALPGRENIVLTRDPEWSEQGVTVLRSLEELFRYGEEKGFEELAIIGGQKILEQTMGRLDVMYLTEVDAEIPGADAFFPDYNPDEWEEVHRFSHPKDDKNEYSWTFRELRRRKA